LDEAEQRLYRKIREKLFKGELEECASITTNEDVLKADVALLKYLMEEHGMRGIMLCVARSHEYYERLMHAKGIDPKKCFFVEGLAFHPSDGFFEIALHPVF